MNKRTHKKKKEDNSFSNKATEKSILWIAMALLATGSIILLIQFNYQPPINNTLQKDYWTVRGTIGDFTAGVVGTFVSLAGLVMIYLSFKKQRESNEAQKIFFEYEKIENRFFELIKLHRENVNELSFTEYNAFLNKNPNITPDLEKHTSLNRKVFVRIFSQFEQLHNEVKFLFDETKLSIIYIPFYLNQLGRNITLKDRKIDFLEYAKIDIIYLIVFFGLGENGKKTILDLTNNKYCANFLKEVLDFASLKPKKESKYWPIWNEINKNKLRIDRFKAIINARAGIERNSIFLRPYIKQINFKKIYVTPYYADDHEKFYGGHQFRLGHYFRHLYQTVCYINKIKFLKSKEQYQYIKHLRGQLSTSEQVLFFLNSISQLGRSWELEDKITGLEIPKRKQLISDYGLIKNIPYNEILTGIKLSNFYPNINYEGFVIPKTETNNRSISLTKEINTNLNA